MKIEKTGPTMVTNLNARVAGYWDFCMGLSFPKNYDLLKKDVQVKYEEGRLLAASKQKAA